MGAAQVHVGAADADRAVVDDKELRVVVLLDRFVDLHVAVEQRDEEVVELAADPLGVLGGEEEHPRRERAGVGRHAHADAEHGRVVGVGVGARLDPVARGRELAAVGVDPVLRGRDRGPQILATLEGLVDRVLVAGRGRVAASEHDEAVAAAELIARELMERFPRGSGIPLFRTPRGRSWTRNNGVTTFCRIKEVLGWDKDADKKHLSFYTCRHTFAKRILSGYWTGQPATIETLAGLMGNTPKVCWDHYARWCDEYNDPLWAAVGRGRNLRAG